MTVKKNQPGLLRLLKLLLASPLSQRAGVKRARTIETGHGRIEERRLEVSAVLRGTEVWPGACQVFRITRKVREKKSGEQREEEVDGITSLTEEQAGPRELLSLVRGHGLIENQTHYVRDVTFEEERSQVRDGSLPQVMAAVRNTAMGLMRQAGWRNIAAGSRYYAARPWEALSLLGIAPG